MSLYDRIQRNDAPKKSTDARRNVKAEAPSGNQDLAAKIAGTQALPVDTLPKPKMGRPRTGYIKAEYNRQYSADLRSIKRLGLEMTVKQYRESLE